MSDSTNAEMEAFDSLPPELRELVREHDLVAIDVYLTWINYHRDTQVVIQKIRAKLAWRRP